MQLQCRCNFSDGGGFAFEVQLSITEKGQYAVAYWPFSARKIAMGYTQPNDFFQTALAGRWIWESEPCLLCRLLFEPFEGFESSLHFLTSLKLRFQAA